MDYQERLRNHLFNYKEYNLGICARQGGSSSAVLPAELKDLNILAGCRKPFRYLSQSNPLVCLQADFNHLASSQALCFNLFFPFLQQPDLWPILLQFLGADEEGVKETEFDFSFGRGPEEVFDFSLSLSSGRQFCFDVKLAENWFGPSYQSGICAESLTSCLRRDIVGLVSGSLLKSPEVAGLFVLLKKLSYVAATPDCRLVCIFPAANLKLNQGMKLLQDTLYENIKEKLVVFHLEELIQHLLAGLKSKNERIWRHFIHLQKKYVVD